MRLCLLSPAELLALQSEVLPRPYTQYFATGLLRLQDIRNDCVDFGELVVCEVDEFGSLGTCVGGREATGRMRDARNAGDNKRLVFSADWERVLFPLANPSGICNTSNA